MQKRRQFYIYILASKENGVLYIGVTNDIQRRVLEHKQKINLGFTNRYNISKLVYYENHDKILLAIKREKQLKKWKRRWKIELIESVNPDWLDLSEEWNLRNNKNI